MSTRNTKTPNQRPKFPITTHNKHQLHPEQTLYIVSLNNLSPVLPVPNLFPFIPVLLIPKPLIQEPLNLEPLTPDPFIQNPLCPERHNSDLLNPLFPNLYFPNPNTVQFSSPQTIPIQLRLSSILSLKNLWRNQFPVIPISSSFFGNISTKSRSTKQSVNIPLVLRRTKR